MTLCINSSGPVINEMMQKHKAAAERKPRTIQTFSSEIKADRLGAT